MKYHINPETGRPGKCVEKVGRCKYAVDWVDPVHYETKELAKRGFEGSKGTQLPKAARKSSPGISKEAKERAVRIDTELYALYQKLVKAETSQEYAVKSLYRSYGEDLWRENAALTESLLELAKGASEHSFEFKTAERYDRAAKEIQEISEEMRPLEVEFEREQWPRVFIVTNCNGHVHSSMDCSTCNKGQSPTRFEWTTDFSGASESEIVEAAGWRACTVCYPDAPVGTKTSLPSKMSTVEERAAAEEKAKRESARNAKRAAAAAKAPTIDGKSIEVKDYLFSKPSFKELKTERAALLWWVEQRQYFASGYGRTTEEKADLKRDMDYVVKKLAEKGGVSEKELFEKLEEKAKAKYNYLDLGEY